MLLPGAAVLEAWLVKRILGTDAYESGYHWISYANQTFLQDNSGFFAVVAGSGEGYRWPVC